MTLARRGLHRWSCFAALATVVSACAAPRRQTAVVAGPAPAPSASVLEVVEPARDDPRTVRCGIDDRPKSVISSVDEETGSALLAKRASVGPTPPGWFGLPQARRRPAPWVRPIPQLLRPRPRPRPQPPAPFLPEPPPDVDDRAEPPEPAPQLQIDPSPLREHTGARLSPDAASASQALRGELAGCAGLAEAADERSFAMLVRLGTAGETISTTPLAPGAPSRYERCLLETACRLHVPPLASPAAVELSVRSHRDLPPPPLAAAFVPVVTMETDPLGSRGVAFAAFRQAADRCGPLRAVGQAVRITVHGGPGLRVREIRTADPDGQRPMASPAIACVVREIGALLDHRLQSPLVSGVIRWRAP